jgi:hypothetical protein
MAILSDFGVTGTNPSVISMVGTSSFQLTQLKYFPRPSAAVSRVLDPQSGSWVIATTPSATNATGQLNFNGPSGQNLLNGQMVRIRAVGNASSLIPVNVTVTLLVNTGPTLATPAYTIIASSGAGTLSLPGNVAKPWSIECVVSGDSASGFIQGQYSAIVNGAYHNTNNTNPWVALDSVISSINLNPVAGQVGVNMVPCGLVVGVTFGTGNFGNTANLYQFQILDI